MNRIRLITTLKVHEGLILKPYKDIVGKTTIGIGRNLDDRGISEDEAYYLLNNDLNNVTKELAASFPFFTSLDEVRQEVLVNMAINLGLPRLKNFKKMIQALVEKKWGDAANEMMNSQWATQVGVRAVFLSQLMRGGAYPTI